MGRFLVGFVIGAAIGAAGVMLTTPRSGGALRQNVSYTVRGALDAAREASASRERELWSDFRTRMANKIAETEMRQVSDPYRRPLMDDV
jgi:gas vesicle protein